jgi:hypothetical protein
MTIPGRNQTGGHLTLDFSSNPLTATNLTVSLSNNYGLDMWYVGIDNVRFGQVEIPEPSLAVLAGLGGLLIVLRRR